MVQNVGGNAVTGIGHRNHHVAPGGDVAAHVCVSLVDHHIAGLDEERAAVRHRVAGVEREIEDRIGKLAGINHRARRIACENHLHVDLLAECRPQQPGCFHHQCIDVDFTRLLAREREQTFGQIGAARNRFVDQTRDRNEFRPICDAFCQNLDRSHNEP